jgi:hypothetical protein
MVASVGYSYAMLGIAPKRKIAKLITVFFITFTSLILVYLKMKFICSTKNH